MEIRGCEVIYNDLCVARVYKGRRMLWSEPSTRVFYMTALENGTITFTMTSGFTGLSDISYSTNGVDYTTVQNTTGRTSDLVVSVNVQMGQRVYWKGHGTTMNSTNGLLETGHARFSSTGKFSVHGNIMSLLDAENYLTTTAFTGSYAFARLFMGSKVKDVFVTLPDFCADGCYEEMFKNCTDLFSAPLLRSNSAAPMCYKGMFAGCTSLQVAPDINCEPNEQRCFEEMFMGCTSITKTPFIPECAYVAQLAMFGMFSNCTSLVTGPEQISVENGFIGPYGCGNMFANCTSMKNIPLLPATEISDWCYAGMFGNCTSLEFYGPFILPAKTLASHCYETMFSNCPNFTQIYVGAEELPEGKTIDDCANTIIFAQGGTIAQRGWFLGYDKLGYTFQEYDQTQQRVIGQIPPGWIFVELD